MRHIDQNAGRDRRIYQRYDTPDVAVDYGDGETFLFSYIENISEMGIFIRSDDPLPVGTLIRVRFAPTSYHHLELDGEVVWVNSVRCDGRHINPGMGVRFLSLTPNLREAVVTVIRTVAYLEGEGEN